MSSFVPLPPAWCEQPAQRGSRIRPAASTGSAASLVLGLALIFLCKNTVLSLQGQRAGVWGGSRAEPPRAEGWAWVSQQRSPGLEPAMNASFYSSLEFCAHSNICWAEDRPRSVTCQWSLPADSSSSFSSSSCSPQTPKAFLQRSPHFSKQWAHKDSP